MKFADVGHKATYFRLFSITDGPVHPMDHSLTGKVFRVDRVKITYTLDGGRWEVPSSWDVDLIGPVLKKDGSDSQNIHSRHPDWQSYRDHRFTEDYAWVAELIENARPVGEVHLPSAEA